MLDSREVMSVEVKDPKIASAGAGLKGKVLSRRAAPDSAVNPSPAPDAFSAARRTRPR